MQVSRSNATHPVPGALGLGRTVARVQGNDLQIERDVTCGPAQTPSEEELLRTLHPGAAGSSLPPSPPAAGGTTLAAVTACYVAKDMK